MPGADDDALRASEARFRALLAHSREAIALFGSDGTILYGSPNTAEILGYPDEEFVGRNAFELIDPDDHAAVQERLVLALGRPGQAVEVAARVRHRDGRWRVLEGIFTNLLEDPAVRAVVNNYRDVTDRRHLEDQLRQAQKMEAVGRLAGGVAHDFNNLLTAILGAAALLRGRCAPGDPALRHIDEVRKAGERAAGLTAQLLAFSRKQVLQPRVVDLKALVANLDEMLRRLIREDIEFTTGLPAAPAWVRVDPGQMEQVLVNLVVNARDAMPGGGRLTVLVETLESAADGLPRGEYVRITVRDTGVGMDPDTLSHVFEPFFTTKDMGQGTGLGLATVYGVLQQSGGSVFVDSVPGQGTAFRVYLPAVAAAPPGPEPAPPPPAPARGGGETVLLVEDEPMVRDMIREVLESAGFQVLEAAHGLAALETARAHRDTIDLMLTDVVMPGMSGPELARRLAPARPEMRVLFASGYTAHILSDPGVLSSGRAFIAKPFTPDDLLAKVREVLDA